jgi:hypothetical protein
MGHPGRARETQKKARGPPGSPGYSFPGFPLGPPGLRWVPLASPPKKHSKNNVLFLLAEEDPGKGSKS